MENNTVLNALASLPMDELTSYHSQLVEQFNNPELHVPTNVDTLKLIPFNGYYALNTTGAFFAIDTNMVIRPAPSTPEYDLSLLISLDGTTSTRFAFTGTFNNNQLLQYWNVGGLDINLSFTRTNSVYGTTVTCAGSIALPGESAVTVSGNTYNNPIPASLFIGEYYTDIKGAQSSVKVMSIGADNQLMYDNGTNSGNLVEVLTYVYNLNMYYFSFMDGVTMVKLIMGTASAQGFACNNMSVTGTTLVSRSLLTIPAGISLLPKAYDLSGIQLADFSGYYQIPLPDTPLAFVSIQAQYATLYEPWNLDLNFVMISYSLDGVTSTGYFFDLLAFMSFDNTTNTLTVPSMPGQEALTLTFSRSYNPSTGSLVNVTGTIGSTSVTGSTLFNPVPLLAFAGVTMTSPDGTDKITINSDNSITYTSGITTNTYNSIIYVPLMYIVAVPSATPVIVLSLGTDGLRGNACIVITNPEKPDQSTTVVYAINGPE